MHCESGLCQNSVAYFANVGSGSKKWSGNFGSGYPINLQFTCVSTTTIDSKI
uniref:Uncharacterized protein n=1 Tax=Romanomermis culicivorax TaxID=13658 RepID=A0A915IBR3_ROMCU